MGQAHNGGFTASTGFNRTSNSPLDDSDIVEFLIDLTNGNVNKPYKMIVIGVLETLKHYYWNGEDITDINNWKPINASELATNFVGNNSDLDDFILNGFYPIADYKIGTIHIEKNSENIGLYARISDTEWLRFNEYEYLKSNFDSRYLLQASEISDLTEEFAWETGDSNNFITNFVMTNLINVFRDRLGVTKRLISSDFNIISTSELEMIFTLENNDIITIQYQHKNELPTETPT